MQGRLYRARVGPYETKLGWGLLKALGVIHVGLFKVSVGALGARGA